MRLARLSAVPLFEGVMADESADQSKKTQVTSLISVPILNEERPGF